MIKNLIQRVEGKLIRLQDESRRRKIPPPSFNNKMAQRKRLAERIRSSRGKSGGPVYHLETKLGQKEVAQRAGVLTPGVLQGPVEKLSDFDLKLLPRKFVIKPVIGSGSNGVFLLEKQDAGIKNLISGDDYPLDLTSLQKAGLDKFEGCPLIAEDLVELDKSPPLDWKVFAFYGEIAFVRQVDLRGKEKAYKMWSAEGEELGRFDLAGFPLDPNLPAAKDFDAIFDAARKISKKLATPFVRVDLYESDIGVQMGEITLRPGSLHKSKNLQKFRPEWDRKLGEMWEDAEARLIEDLGESYLP